MPESGFPPFLKWILIFGAVSGACLLALLFPYFPAFTLILLLIMVVGVAFAQRRGFINLRPLVTLFTRRGTIPEQRDAPRWWLLLEIGLIVAAAVYVTRNYLTGNADTVLNGAEVEWLTSSVHYAAHSIRRYGYLPLWQPLLEFGEPLIDNPFSFVLNPVSFYPALLFGSMQGLKISITLYAIIAAIGGWFVGRMLNLSVVGRVLLALLLLGKGNMVAMIGEGYYQLGVSQAYLPWAIGGALGILRTRHRWPIVLTAITLTLMFFAGNIWYLLPALLSIAGLTAAGVYRGGQIDRDSLKRLAFAGVLTIGLSAVTLLPIWIERDQIGEHPGEQEAGIVNPLPNILPLYFDPDPTRAENLNREPKPGSILPENIVMQLYYSYVVPLWFFGLIFVLIPPIAPYLHRSGTQAGWRVWMVGIGLLIIATLWGAGGNPLFLWLYDASDLFAQWRFVGRALAMGSLWLAILVAMRADSLFRAIGTFNPRLLRYGLSIGLLAACGFAAASVNTTWERVGQPTHRANWYWPQDELCITWLRDHHPQGDIRVYMQGYTSVVTFIQNDVRLHNVEADYRPLPIFWTLGQIELAGFWSLPPYAYVRNNEYNWLEFFPEHGYTQLLDSPPLNTVPCLWHNPDTLPFAYTLPLRVAESRTGQSLDVADVTPITHYGRLPDRIGLIVEANPTTRLVVTVQELAYPGWYAQIDGETVTLESVGGQLGVILPAGTGTHRIYFEYAPPLLYLGAVITLVTAIFTAGYLLRVDRILGITS